jgi:hypothetical protein
MDDAEMRRQILRELDQTPMDGPTLFGRATAWRFGGRIGRLLLDMEREGEIGKRKTAAGHDEYYLKLPRS